MRSNVQKADILIAGGGFAGLSTAYHLALRKPSLRIFVLEQEKNLGGHASGRNAGMIRQAVEDPFIARLAKEGRLALEAAVKRGWKMGYRPSHSFLTAKGASVRELEAIERTARRHGIPVRRLSRSQASSTVSLLGKADLEAVLDCPTDAVLDIELLIDAFLRALAGLKVRIVRGHAIRRIEKQNGSFRVTAGQKSYEAPVFVNAAGAWAGAISRLAHAQDIPFFAYRRHLFMTTEAYAGSKAWPFVWDLHHGLYFRPKDGALLVSPCDKKLFRLRLRSSGSAERVDGNIQRLVIEKFRRFAPGFEAMRVRSGKAGLRTMTRDGRFVVGEDARLKGFHWVAGLGGHGVTTSFSVGRMAAEGILDRRIDPALQKAFSPRRFVR